MAFVDWTATGVGEWLLDTGTKYAGNSSCRCNCNGVDIFTRNAFSCTEVQIIAWLRNSGATIANQGLQHPSYGVILLGAHDTSNTWAKWRFTFWYDSASNTKFGRLELWVTDHWEQKDTDINFGTGAPAADSINLYGSASLGYFLWFDEVEVYTA